jgi:hypothetical protein
MQQANAAETNSNQQQPAATANNLQPATTSN